LNLAWDYAKIIFDYLLPQRCLLCNEETDNVLLCNNCLDYIPSPQPPLCKICGRPVKEKGFCGYCKEPLYIDHGRAFLIFIPPIDRLIHYFKYRKMTKLAVFLGRAMANIIANDLIMNKADMIVPVPLYWWKSYRRGYNQAGLLAQQISQETGIISRELIKRVKNTRSQTKLTGIRRRENIVNAFQMNSNGAKGKTIILIDDVMTTGATINECARILKQAEAKAVYSCVAAITP
jgi:competence protein ComFC